MLEDKLYHVVVTVVKTGVEHRMTDKPVTHSEGCVLLSKITDYTWRTKSLTEVL